jgi:cystathionine beta-lyase/cystathionine gamma-synthase
MLSFRLTDGAGTAKAFFDRLRLAYAAPSLGGVQPPGLVPAVTSHRGLREEERRALGITEDLLRVSCGIEHPDDLVEDFEQALDGA